MERSDGCCSTQLIDRDGVFNITGIDNLIKEVRFEACGLSYAIVSIIGPQSSGKSTLLNHLFGTKFVEMDALKGRYPTTEGIWLANCTDIQPFTLVMDLKGTDGIHRGEDDIAFEKQSALFALAVSDILLMNVWCHDIGRVHGSSYPLLETVFQNFLVMMRSFSPRKRTLMFVIRDKTKMSMEELESILREDVQKIWNSVLKPQAHMETPLSEFFNVKVVALSSYEEKEEQFKEQVAELKQKFIHSTNPGELAEDRRGVIPASTFSFSAQQIWEVIKENKDLNLPAHKVMLAAVRCGQIADEKFDRFAANEEWCHLVNTVQSGPVPGFGKKLSSILNTYLSEYDAETSYFDEGVKFAKREQLKEKLLLLGQPAFQSLLKHIHRGTLEKFKKAFDEALNGGEGFSKASRDSTTFYMAQFAEGCADAVIEEANWDTSEDSNELRRCIDAHIASVRVVKLSELTTLHEGRLKESLSEILEVVFGSGANNQTWPIIRHALRCETKLAVTGLVEALSGFDMDEQTKDTMVSSIEKYARGVVEEKARKEASIVLTRMIERFLCDFYSIQRVWTGNEGIRAITQTARSAALKLLSVMTVLRLDADDTDSIEDTLTGALMDSTKAAVNDGSNTTFDPLASSTWEEFPSSRTLISPVQCKSLWLQFEEKTVIQATFAQKANKPNNRSRPVGGTVLAAAVLSVLGSCVWNFMKKNTSDSNAGSGPHASAIKDDHPRLELSIEH